MALWFEHNDTEEAVSFEEVHARLEALVADMGIDHFAVAMARLASDGGIKDDLTVVTNYPREWVERYMENRYDRIDPVIELAARSSRPFFWGGASFLGAFRKPQRRVFDEARDFGIVSGLAIPFHGPHRAQGLFTVAHDDAHRLRDVVRHNSDRLFAAAFGAWDSMSNRPVDPEQGTGPYPDLTAREKECLLWTAEGKTAEDVAAILGLSVFTVNRHVSNAARKLGCINKHHAVYRALATGLIHPAPARTTLFGN